MLHTIRRSTSLVLLVLCAETASQAPADVLRFYESVPAREIRLVDANSTVVHVWPVTGARKDGVALLDDGTVLRGYFISPSNGVQRLALDGSILWDYRTPTQYVTHHDLEVMPNGNVLLIASEVKTRAEAVAHGRNPATLGETMVPDLLIEVQPTGPTSGVIVWEWHIWDHLIQDFDAGQANFGVVGSHPELLDINFPSSLLLGNELTHVNGIDYDPIHDWIVLSAPVQNEIWIIDHSTTTAEAAGHAGGRWGKGGDLLYRWGNPRAYRAAPGSARMLHFQHDPQFIPPGYPGAGNVTVFDNNALPIQSAVLEIVLPVDPSGRFVRPYGGAYGPAAPVWSYTAPGFYSSGQSGAERLPNGNTLVCSGKQGWLFEVTPAGQRVWEHRSPVGTHAVFHAHHTQRSLWADRETLSARAGGAVQFELIAGSPRAGEIYLMLGSASGTDPGFSFSGVNVPLNPDGYTASLLASLGTGIFVTWVGTLNSAGRASADFALPPLPFLAGLTLDHAMLTIDPATNALSLASNPVPLRFDP